MKTVAFIDASNLFYGGKKSLGWSVDFEKLFQYLNERFQISDAYYFGGVEIYEFPFDYLKTILFRSKSLKFILLHMLRKTRKN